MNGSNGAAHFGTTLIQREVSSTVLDPVHSLQPVIHPRGREDLVSRDVHLA